MQQTSGCYDEREKSKLDPSTHTTPDQKFFDLQDKILKALSNYSKEINDKFTMMMDSAAKVYLINKVGSMSIIYQYLCSLDLYTDDEYFYLFPEIKGDMEQIIKGVSNVKQSPV